MEQFLPVFYAKLRKMKYTGDQKMNEILLKQIELFQEWLLESSRDAEKLKGKTSGQHDSLLASVNEKEAYYGSLKQDAIDDVKNLFLLERKMKFIDAEFALREEREKNLKGTKFEGYVPSQMSQGQLTQLTSEELEAREKANEILGRLRERLEQTNIKDMDMQKLIQGLPIA